MALMILLATGVIYLVGPRESVGRIDSSKELVLADDLDLFLESSEAKFGDDLVGETAKKIFWAPGFEGKQTPLSVVYLHGFSGSHMTLAPVMNEVASELGANLYCARYAGHGLKDPEGFGGALGDATLQEWVDDTREALAIGRRIGERVVILANSTAAPIATRLASEGQAPDVLVFLSPNFGPKSLFSELLLKPWGRQIAWLSCWGEYGYAPQNIMGADHARYATTRYPSGALMAMMKTVEYGRAADLERIDVPTLVLYSVEDQVVSSAKTEDYCGRIGSGSATLMPVTTSHVEKHVLAGELMADSETKDVTRRIVDFVRSQ
jgi:alpha-beta hydrolase superfamily lysophospholipase